MIHQAQDLGLFEHRNPPSRAGHDLLELLPVRLQCCLTVLPRHA